MKQIKLIILIVLFFALPVRAENFICKVKLVHDGDTFTCSDGKRIRLWGIDTPEISPVVSVEEGIINGGYKAREYLSKYILNKPIACGRKDQSYDRIVAQCYYNGYDIAVSLLKNKYAREETKYSKGYYEKLFRTKNLLSIEETKEMNIAYKDYVSYVESKIYKNLQFQCKSKGIIKVIAIIKISKQGKLLGARILKSSNPLIDKYVLKFIYASAPFKPIIGWKYEYLEMQINIRAKCA